MITTAVSIGFGLFQAVNSYQRTQAEGAYQARALELQTRHANRALSAQLLLGGLAIATPIAVDWYARRRQQVARWAVEDKVALAEPEPAPTQAGGAGRGARKGPPPGYPMEREPGSLRQDLGMYGFSGRRTPLVLLVPASVPPDASWGAGLLSRVRAELSRYQERNGYGNLLVRRADRGFDWPHDLFHAQELRDRPTIVVELVADKDRLDIQIGGCHLGPPPGSVPFPSRTAFTLPFQRIDDWDRTQAGHYGRPMPSNEQSLTELNHELAARIAAMCVIAAVDSHHIMATAGYDELLDDAIAHAGKVADDWDVDYLPYLSMAADPAYHALHSTARLMRRGQPGAARTHLRRALTLLGGTEPDIGHALEPPTDAELRHLIEQAVSRGLMHTKHRAKLLEVLQLPGLDPSGELVGLLTARLRDLPLPEVPHEAEPPTAPPAPYRLESNFDS